MKNTKLFYHLSLLALLGALAMASAADKGDYPLTKCVVSGEAFGGDLGPPVDVNYKGHTLRLCCKSCVKKFKADPEKYLAIYEKEVKKKGQ